MRESIILEVEENPNCDYMPMLLYEAHRSPTPIYRVRLEEPAVDLGVALAVASSFRDVPADSSTVVAGEVGLGGEIRAVARIEPRLAEAKQLGFERMLLPKANTKNLEAPKGLELLPVSQLSEALDLVL